MTNSKNTKRALLASVFSVMLCVALLAGSTFAWFTDSVTSGNNKIVAGNLDIELEYATEFDAEGIPTKWATVAGATDLFNPDALWEPGHTEVAVLKIRNNGSLALKYQMRINSKETNATNVNGETFYLSDFLVFNQTDDATLKDRSEYWNAELENAVLQDGKAQSNPSFEGLGVADDRLTPGEEKIFTLAVYMPTSVGNEANWWKKYSFSKAPSVELGIQIVASQLSYETDSFGPDYDEDMQSVWDGQTVDTSWYDETKDLFVISSAEQLAGLASLCSENTTSDKKFANKAIELIADFDFAGNEIPQIKVFGGKLNGNGHTITNFEIRNEEQYIGFIGKITSGGLVENLVIDNAVIEKVGSKDGATGIHVGSLTGGTVKNIKVTGESSVTGGLRTGGIVGELRSGAQVIDCENHASVSGTAIYTGGIVGAAHNSGVKTFEGCVNYGDVNGTTEVGGIIGYADRAIIANCENHGNVSGTGSYGVGGILGFDTYNSNILSSPKNGSTIKACKNYGTIKAPNHVGGILGTFACAPGKTQPSNRIYSTLEDCVNYGDVIGTAKCGTLFGYQHSYAAGDADNNINNLYVKLIRCTNEGTLNGEASEQMSGSSFAEIE